MATGPALPEEYDDPEEYDREKGLASPEISFYRALADEVGGPALDLVCDIGFLATPLAPLGFASRPHRR